MNDLSAQQYVILGGPAMVPIVISSVAALTIMVRKYHDLKKSSIQNPHLKNDIFALIRENKIKAAILSCEKDPSSLSRVLKSGLLQFGSTREDIKETVNTAISLEIPKLTRGLTPLITIANAAPLFGILGTVLGMAMIFQTISVRTAAMDPVTLADLAGGIWQALLTTIAGLVVAIPSFVGYNYFATRVDESTNELMQAGEDLAHLLTRLNESSTASLTENSDAE